MTNIGSASLKIIISAQVGDGEPIEVGEATVPLKLEATPIVQLEKAGAFTQLTITGTDGQTIAQAISDALCGHTHVANTSGKPEPILTPEQWDKLKAGRCGNHKPVQHRDGKPPWCNTCRKR